ncbi:MAG: glycosyltransferase [Rickettsiales bacterium]|nr:glycosyltransferase [Rickettsiales bacterium]
MLFICFAAYNEEQNIAPLLRRIAACMPAGTAYRVVAYNDGSTDATLAELERHAAAYPLVVMNAAKNGGLGVGTNALLTYVAKEGVSDDVAVFMDADDTHDPSVIALMQAEMAKGADVVIASRYQPGKVATGLRWHRHVISWGASVFWRVMLPIRNVKDYSCGFRAYRVGVVQQAMAASGGGLITRPGFECQVEILSRLRPFARFAEVPINLAYDRKQGASKMRFMRTTRRTLSLGMYLLLTRCLGTKQG